MTNITLSVDYLEREALRRSRFETHLDILKAISEGAGKPTHIMYRANLSWVALQAYLKSLIKKRLIVVKEDGGRKIYELTDEGYKIMDYSLKIKMA